MPRRERNCGSAAFDGFTRSSSRIVVRAEEVSPLSISAVIRFCSVFSCLGSRLSDSRNVEIALSSSGGLRRYYAGWLLDLMNIAQGLIVNPLGVYRGYMRGRSTSNLYQIEFSDELLEARVGEYRSRLRLTETPASPTAKDRLAFAFWVLASALTYIVAVSLPILPLLLLVLWILWA